MESNFKGKQIINILMVSDDENDFRNLNMEFMRNKVINPLSLVFNNSEPSEHLKKKIIELMRVSTPSIILLDISLPELNGLEHLKWLAEGHELMNSRLFIITSSDEVRKYVISARYKIAGFIDKPVSFLKFASAISATKSSWLYYEPGGID